jgi:hypothetical protein
VRIEGVDLGVRGEVFHMGELHPDIPEEIIERGEQPIRRLCLGVVPDHGDG